MDQMNIIIAVIAAFLSGACGVSLLWNLKSAPKNTGEHSSMKVAETPANPPKRRTYGGRTLSNQGRRWTREEDQYVLDNITTRRKILAKNVGRTEKAVSQRISQLRG